MEGLIYKLYIPGLDEICYVGSTRMALKDRFVYHQNAAKYDSQTKARSHVLFSEGNEPTIECLEEGTYASKEELEARERYWIGRFPECLNHNIPGRTWQERWALNRDHNLAKHKAWIEAHKDEQAEYKRLKREADLAAARAADKLSNQNRDKEKRKAWKNAKVTCDECKLVLSRNNFPTHKKNKHSDMDVKYTVLNALLRIY